ncbi:methyl-accepting chemotaxis protein [Priestia abyssalis]|uniref:methyl-accepting chemotaxis protein n=1 Tax=Priestia abyssalis TaxID=1221450 RepID=UPI0009954238|nr:methyl-accepting chemotaxis protein [Priestia abyssalis]
MNRLKNRKKSTFFPQKSLSTKLLIILLITSILPLVLSTSMIYTNTTKGFTSLVNENKEAVESAVTNKFDSTFERLLELSNIYAADQELITAFKAGNQSSLAEKVQPVFERLQKEHQLEVLEWGTTEGTVFFRGHNPEKFGDDKSDIPAVQQALNGKESAGFEFGSSGLAVRAFVPIKSGSEIIGTLQTGVDDSFLKDLKHTLHGVNLDLYDSTGKIVVSSENTNIGKSLADRSLIDTLQSGKKVSTKSKEAIQTFIPMYDPTKSEVIGFISISQDVSFLNKLSSKITLLSIFLTAAAMIVVMIVVIIFSRSITRPLKQVTSFMGEFSKGNLAASFEGKERQDEIGQLSSSITEMKERLKDMVEQIADVSVVIKRRSTKLNQSSKEIKAGSHQVAVTMQGLSAGSESQAHTALELAQIMKDFTAKVHEANENGNEVAATANNVFHLTASGKDLMDSSVGQMKKIHSLVEDSVLKVQRLDDQSREISKLVQVIQSVSDQTNLLALNAAIEAARAGEHGKGFAVVADEVRKLAGQVSHSIVDITNIVESIQEESKQVTTSLQQSFEQVKAGTDQMTSTGETFEQIKHSLSLMLNKIKVISINLTDITTNTAEVHTSIENISSISEEFAAGVEETAASVQQNSSSMEQIASHADSLDQLAKELQVLMEQFKIN